MHIIDTAVNHTLIKTWRTDDYRRASISPLTKRRLIREAAQAYCDRLNLDLAAPAGVTSGPMHAAPTDPREATPPADGTAA